MQSNADKLIFILPLFKMKKLYRLKVNFLFCFFIFFGGRSVIGVNLSYVRQSRHMGPAQAKWCMKQIYFIITFNFFSQEIIFIISSYCLLLIVKQLFFYSPFIYGGLLLLIPFTYEEFLFLN